MDDRYLLTGCDDGVVRAWDLDSGELHYENAAHSQSITDISFSPDGRKLLTASRDGTARLWDTDSGLPGTIVLHHSPQILSPTLSNFDTYSHAGMQRHLQSIAFLRRISFIVGHC